MFTIDTAYHMDDDMQFVTSCMALLVCFVVYLGVKSIVDRIASDELKAANREAVEAVEAEVLEFADDMLLKRDNHWRLRLVSTRFKRP